jgi:hypothetical protein
MSENIEDRRGEADERNKLLYENTEQLKRLNDFLLGVTGGPGRAVLPMGAYGLAGGAGAGGGAPVSAGGGGAAAAGPSGAGGEGIAGGVIGSGGELGGVIGRVFGGGGPSGRASLGGRGRGGAARGGGFAGDASFASSPGPANATNAFIASRRASFAHELSDPSKRLQFAAMMMSENPGAAQAVAESAMNRSDLTHKSLMQMLHSGFYGPINRGQLGSYMEHLRRDPRAMARMNAAIDSALAGSDIIHGATDQGSGHDPNVNWPGGRTVIHGETFNDWAGGGGHAASARWRENFERGAAGGVVGDRGELNRRALIPQTHRVEGSADINVNVSAPPGTRVTGKSAGLFKPIAMTRQTQMAHAAQGPSTAAGAEFNAP